MAAEAVNASRGTRLGRIAGVPILLTPSWPVSLLIVVVVVAVLSGRVLPDQSAVSLGLAAVALTLLLMASVLIHELGHLFAAKSVHHQVLRIRFDVLSGQTDLVGSAGTGADAYIALAGPAMSAVCSAAGFGAAQLLQNDTTPWLLAMAIGITNALLTIFNLLPAYPLDGGEVVRTLVWRISGSWRTGSIAGYLSTMVVCAGLLVLAGFVWFRGGPGSAPQAVVIVALMIHLAATVMLEWRRDDLNVADASGSTHEGPLAARLTAAADKAEPGERPVTDATAPPSATSGRPADVVLLSDGYPELAELVGRSTAATFLLVDQQGEAAGILSRAELDGILSSSSGLPGVAPAGAPPADTAPRKYYEP